MKKIIHLILISVLFVSCSKKEIVETQIKGKNLDTQVLEAYNEGLSALQENDVLFAAKKFNEAEMLFPQSDWAPKSALMAAYSYYIQDYYGDTILELERFIKIYPNHKNIDYANYLLAICYYEQIIDETKDINSINQAKKHLTKVVNDFPKTEYAMDSRFKLELIEEILASKEMYIGRYYVEREKWIPAINRFKTIVDEYDTTIYVEEALFRLVEIYYLLGLEDESKKYANTLGYNYQSSIWYEKSYVIFDKMYERNKEENKNKSNLLKKFKSIFE